MWYRWDITTGISLLDFDSGTEHRFICSARCLGHPLFYP